MSENQNVRNIYKKEYAGFFTEDSIGSLEDVNCPDVKVFFTVAPSGNVTRK